MVGLIPSQTEPEEVCVWGNIGQAARLHRVSKWDRGRPSQGQSNNGHATAQDSNTVEILTGQATGHPPVHLTVGRQVPTFQPPPT